MRKTDFSDAISIYILIVQLFINIKQLIQHCNIYAFIVFVQ